MLGSRANLQQEIINNLSTAELENEVQPSQERVVVHDRPQLVGEPQQVRREREVAGGGLSGGGLWLKGRERAHGVAGGEAAFGWKNNRFGITIIIIL